MKSEAQRIAIAEACGWTDISFRYTDTQECIISGTNPHPDRGDNSDLGYVLPDYLNDLNAMHSALIHVYKTQPAGWAARFEEILNEVCSRRQYPQWFAWCAEAQDLAEAFIKSLNLWTES